MKEFIKGILPRIRSYSKELDIAESIIDHPWIWITDQDRNQKIIFRRGGVLLLVENGQVQTGTWEIIPSLNSILLDRNIDKVLMNYAFVNETIMLLKKDSTDEIVPFVNEAKLPNLNFQQYLTTIATQSKEVLPSSASAALEPNVELKKFELELENVDMSLIKACTLMVCKNSSGVKEPASTLQAIYINHSRLTDVNGVPIRDGYYRVSPSLYEKTAPGDRISNDYYQLSNGFITNRFWHYIANKEINGKKVLLFLTEGYSSLHSQIVYSGSYKLVEDGKYKLGVMEYVTVVKGKVVDMSLFR